MLCVLCVLCLYVKERVCRDLCVKVGKMYMPLLLCKFVSVCVCVRVCEMGVMHEKSWSLGEGRSFLYR